jgi:hypothetical protein
MTHILAAALARSGSTSIPLDTRGGPGGQMGPPKPLEGSARDRDSRRKAI